jgi:hypothetical protein
MNKIFNSPEAEEAIKGLKEWASRSNKEQYHFLQQDLKKVPENHKLYDDIKAGVEYIEKILQKDSSSDITEYQKKVHELLLEIGITPSEIWIVDENVVPLSTKKDTVRNKVRGGIQKVAEVFSFKK